MMQAKRRAGALGMLGVMLLSGAVHGDAIDDFVHREIARQGPLQMTTAGIIDDRGIVPNRAAGYEVTEQGIQNQEWVSPTSNSTGDGSLYLTVLDFATWDAALRDRKILEPESRAEVFKPVTLNSGKTYPYGFGWSLEKSPGERGAYQHGGAWQGFRTFYIRYLDTEISVIAMANSTSADVDTLARGVAGLYEPKVSQLSFEPLPPQ